MSSPDPPMIESPPVPALIGRGPGRQIDDVVSRAADDRVALGAAGDRRVARGRVNDVVARSADDRRMPDPPVTVAFPVVK